MKKFITILALIVIVAIALGYINKDKKAKTDSISKTTTQTSSLPSIASSTQTYALSEVNKHNKPGDCWTTINSKVYNLSTWPEKHPGGSKAILALCGIDGTQQFNKAHGGQAQPEQVLGTFLIGNLDK